MNKILTCPYCEENLPIINNISRCPTCAEKLPDDFIKNTQDSYVAENENNEAQKLGTEQINCPYCNEVISSRAKKCKHCGEFLDTENNRNYHQGKDMSFLACIKRGFTSLLDFKGRSTRKEYWYYILTILIGTLPLSGFAFGLISSGYHNWSPNYIYYLGILFLVLLTIIGNFLSLAILFRRCNDVSDNKIIRFLPYLQVIMATITMIILLSALVIPEAMVFYYIWNSVLSSIIGMPIFIISLFPSKK